VSDVGASRTGAGQAAAGQRAALQPVTLHPLPKVVFLYPTLIAAVVAAIGTDRWEDRAAAWGLGFLVVFFLNLMVLSFDFPRTTSLTLLFLVVAVVLGVLLLNQRYDFIPAVQDWTDRLEPGANPQFYWLIAIGLAVIYAGVVIVGSQFDYWEVRPNEIVHRHGILGNVNRYPSLGVGLQKEITDVFEFVLLHSGRLVLQPSQGPAIVLDNVWRVNQRERDIHGMLRVLDVEFHR
jgi:hypothetical protein